MFNTMSGKYLTFNNISGYETKGERVTSSDTERSNR